MVTESFNVKGSNVNYSGDRETYYTRNGEHFTLGTVNRNKKTDPSVLLAGESSVNVNASGVYYSSNAFDSDYKYDYDNYKSCPQYASNDSRGYNGAEELRLDVAGADLLKQIVDTINDGYNVLSENDIFQFVKNFKNKVGEFADRIKRAGINLIDARYDSTNGVYTVDYEGDDGTIRSLSFDYDKGGKDKSIGSKLQPYEEIYSRYLDDPRTPENPWDI